MARKQSKFLRGRRIDPKPITGGTKLVDLVDDAFVAYNAARLREACWLFTQKMLEPDVTIGVTLTGALTPAGLGMSALIPLIKAGFIDWIISTGANFYHDTHFGIGLAMHEGNAQTSDIVLRDEEVVRIYDIFFDYSVLLDTDAFFRKVIEAPEFQRPMSTAEFHYLAGRYVWERERKLGLKSRSLLAAAHEYAIPLYTSSPGDSSIGMNVAAKALQGNKLAFDPSLDVNETAAIVLAAKRGLIHDGYRTPTSRVATGSRIAGERRLESRRFSFSAEVRQRTSRCKLSPRFRKSWASTNAATITFFRSPMRGRTLVDFRAPRRARQSRGARSILSVCPTRSCVTSTRRWRCPSSQRML